MFKKKIEMEIRGEKQVIVLCKKCGEKHLLSEKCYTDEEDKNLIKLENYKKNIRKGNTK